MSRRVSLSDGSCRDAGVPPPGVGLREALEEGASSQLLEELRQQDWLQHDGQRRSGVYYTPPDLADQVVRLALDTLERVPTRVLEPGCGCGAFFRALDRNLEPAEGSRFFGVERDPVAAQIASLHANDAADRRVYVGDALSLTPPQPLSLLREPDELDGPFDLVVGNPPFGSAIRSDTGRTNDEKRRFRDRFPLAARGAYDRCALFVELALERVSSDGVIAMVLPASFLASPAATTLRGALAEHGEVNVHPVEGSERFAGAAVNVCVVTVSGARKKATSADATSWSPMLTGHAQLMRATAGMLHSFGDCVDVRASATVAEAYEWKPQVVERDQAPPGAPALVVSGSIEPGELLWGEVSTRYLGTDYQHPVLPRDALSSRRRAAVDTPGVLVAGLSRVLEACAVQGGAHCGAVATLRLRRAGDGGGNFLDACEAVVNSSWFRLVYRARYSALQLAGGNLQATRRKLEGLPIPDSWAALLRGERRLPSGALSGGWLKRLPSRAEWRHILAAADGGPLPTEVRGVEREQFSKDATLLAMSSTAREAIAVWLRDGAGSAVDD